MPPDYITVKKFHELTGMPKSTVRDFCRKGRLCHARMGRVVLINYPEFLEQMRQTEVPVFANNTNTHHRPLGEIVKLVKKGAAI